MKRLIKIKNKKSKKILSIKTVEEKEEEKINKLNDGLWLAGKNMGMPFGYFENGVRLKVPDGLWIADFNLIQHSNECFDYSNNHENNYSYLKCDFLISDLDSFNNSDDF